MVDRSSFDSLDFDFLWKGLSIRFFSIRIEASLFSSVIEYKVEQSVFELFDAQLVKLLIVDGIEGERDLELEFVFVYLHNSIDIRD